VAKVSLRLATRSSWRASPQTSSTTAPSASQASASAAVRNAASVSGARTVTTSRGSRPSSHNPLIDSAPDSISEKSCRTQTSGRRGDTLPASPAIKPVAVALWWPSANTSCTAAVASPPCSTKSAAAWPSATLLRSDGPPWLSICSMVPRKLASVFVRAALMRRSFRNFAFTASSRVNPRLAHLFMMCSNIKLTEQRESIGIDT
jgi:hypothetical protein